MVRERLKVTPVHRATIACNGVAGFPGHEEGHDRTTSAERHRATVGAILRGNPADRVRAVLAQVRDLQRSASRSEYWWWELIELIVGGNLLAIYIPSLLAARTGGHDIRIDTGIIIVIVLGGIWGLATIVPSIALTWRRLHDANLSGLFWLLALIPSVGGLIVLVLTLLPSKPEGARFDAPAV